MTLYEFLITNILPLFVESEKLSTNIPFLHCNLLNIFDILFIFTLSFVIISCSIILPYKILKRIAGGAKKRVK